MSVRSQRIDLNRRLLQRLYDCSSCRGVCLARYVKPSSHGSLQLLAHEPFFKIDRNGPAQEPSDNVQRSALTSLPSYFRIYLSQIYRRGTERWSNMPLHNIAILYHFRSAGSLSFPCIMNFLSLLLAFRKGGLATELVNNINITFGSAK